eukprot:TRINITY_DN4406_c0_g2_i1.p1 TRINITY_DN4406_c0_g2~~TRINITY_DN4406_c0_g2_i1.p1  ORF type:complete len:281 (+),score=53.60 TRINITY_DN4406_c0_g2_i1:89-844(+)
MEAEDLKDIEDIESHLTTLLERLDSKDWVVACEALTNVRQLSNFHKETLSGLLGDVITLTIKSIKNPRSALCKTAIMTSADLLKGYQDQMIDFLDPLLLQLLLKASQDKRFVCEAAENALTTMTTSISPVLLLEKLQAFVKHRNPRIRAKASMCICKSVNVLGEEGVKEYGLETLIQIAASQINDRLPEAREAARMLCLELKAAHDKYFSMDQTQSDSSQTSIRNSWEQFCVSRLSPVMAQAVLRATSLMA